MMEYFNLFGTNYQGLFLAVALLWSAVWKGLGLWRAGRNNQVYWFLAMFILNTAGILPIVYLIWFSKKRRR